MKVIALEEAFSMEGLKMVPETNDWPIPIDPQIMGTWGHGCVISKNGACQIWMLTA
jgi:hypothetical protein